MADNLTTQTTVSTVPSGSVIATEEIGGAHYQKVAIVLTDGTTINALLDAGQQLSAASLPVVLSSDHSDIKVTLDGETVAISGTVSVQSNSADLATEATAGAIKDAVEILDNAISGSEMQTDIVTITAGASADIGATTDAEATGNGSVIALLKRLRTLLGGTLTVDGSGVTQPVSGTVTANLSATDNAVLDSIDTAVNGTLTVDASGTAVPVTDNGGTLTVDNAALSVTGGGVEATALRVTIASDSTGLVSVDDGGGSLTVDGTVAISGTVAVDATGQGDLPVTLGGEAVTIDDIQDGAGDSIMDPSNDAMRVNIVAGSSSGTEYTEDDPAAANPAGGAVSLVRQDTPAGVTSADGDVVTQRGTDYGAAFVQVVDSSGNFIDTFGGSGGTAAADDADFTAGSTQATPVMGVYESSPSSVTDGDMGVAGITPTRELRVKHDDDVTIADGGNSITVDGTVTADAGTGPWPVTDNGGSLTVDGTVTETNSADILADTANMDTNIGTIAGAVSGSEVQVDVVAALPAGTNAIGKLAANSGVDIGDVDVTSVIPGTGATNLGKARGSATGATDTGVAVLMEKQESNTFTVVADGAYGNPTITSWREIRTRDQRALDLANCNDHTVFTVLSDDTDNKADSTNHVFGTGAVTFDKVNGTANTVFAGLQDTITSVNIQEIFESGAFAGLGVYLPSIADVVNVFLRIGTDSSNYNEWEWDVDSLSAGRWLALRMSTSTPSSVTANGWDTAAITYVAFGVEFSDETDTLTGIVFDNVHLVGGRVTDSTTDATITSSVSSPNVNLHKVGNKNVDTNTGNASSGTQRVVLASDQPAVTVDGSGVTQPVSAASLPLPSGASTAANQTTIIGHVDGLEGLLTTIDADTGTLAGAVSGSEMQVDIVSSAAVPVTDNGGSLTVDGTVAVSGTVTVDSELPAAAAMADASSNPTVPAVAARNTVFNGSTWDRMRGNTTGAYVHGATAHDAVDAGNPIKVGGKAYETDGTAPGTAVAENDRANFITDRYGRQLVQASHPNSWTANAEYTTAQTDVSVKAAPGAGLSLYITDIIVSTDTAFNCFFEHGSTKIVGPLYLAANGGMSSNLTTPIRLPTNTALTFTSSATANHSIVVNGYIAP